jgi:hypothetical protein
MKINSPFDTYATLVTISTWNNYEKKNFSTVEKWYNIEQVFHLKLIKNKNKNYKFTQQIRGGILFVTQIETPLCSWCHWKAPDDE